VNKKRFETAADLDKYLGKAEFSHIKAVQ